MNREINGAGRLGNREIEILPGVVGGGDWDGSLICGFDDGLAHAAGFSSDEERWHIEI